MELHHLERKKSSDLSVQSVRRPEHANPSNSKEPPEGKMTKSVVSLKSEASVPRQKVVRLARIQFLTLCWTLFHIGWNDGSTGPLIPRIREHYNVKETGHYKPISVLSYFTGWICVGFLDIRICLFGAYHHDVPAC